MLAAAAASTASAAAADSGEAGTYDVMQELSTFNAARMPARRRLPRPKSTSPSRATRAVRGRRLRAAGHQAGRLHAEQAAWLGDAPVVSDIADTEDCDVLVIGAGNAGTVAALRCQEEGANVFLADMQTYDEYDEYACDMACYNSKLFLDKGTPRCFASVRPPDPVMTGETRMDPSL